MSTFNKSDEEIIEYLEELTSKSVHIGPKKEAAYITMWYLVLGSLWILFSDAVVNALISDPEIAKAVQLIKGWLYVLITGCYIYTLIYYRMRLLKNAAEEIHEGYSDLAAMQEELLEKEDEIFELSHYDRMTGLLNWVGLSVAFENIIEKELFDQYAVLYIDIDNIKHVNDTLGHEKGNLVLKQIGLKLKAISKEHDVLARVSGDEFVLVTPFDNDISTLHKRINSIRKHLQTTWKFDRYEFLITSSMGVAMYPSHGTNLEIVLKNADSAMFIAKEKGRDQHYFYDEKISKKTENYIEMVTQIRYGISNHEFVLFYQPIIDLKTNEIHGVEALIRWQHPVKGFLTPYHFIKIAEESGQINEIGRWVFESACKQYKLWNDKGSKPFKISVNLSSKRLYCPSLIKDMKSALEFYHVDPQWIQIEITETAVMENLKKAITILTDIRELGMTIALDDFGTGYSSLTYLQMFPIQVLKIDKEFIKNISVGQEDKDKKIISSVIHLAHSLGLDVVAEGIEYKDQETFLKKHTCDLGQGYYFDKPMAVEAFEEHYML